MLENLSPQCRQWLLNLRSQGVREVIKELAEEASKGGLKPYNLSKGEDQLNRFIFDSGFIKGIEAFTLEILGNDNGRQAERD